mmetsp:Transcript_35798/g.70429  ORF Transcript_35798/g.70429 Transcript_35798/m.70429 type:complete len:97 (+) Transcript_35798:475-765(+)
MGIEMIQHCTTIVTKDSPSAMYGINKSTNGATNQRKVAKEIRMNIQHKTSTMGQRETRNLKLGQDFLMTIAHGLQRREDKFRTPAHFPGRGFSFPS